MLWLDGITSWSDGTIDSMDMSLSKLPQLVMDREALLNVTCRDFLVASVSAVWLRLHTPNAWGLGSISGQETRSHMPELKDPSCHTKMEDSKTKTQHDQENT